MGMPSQSVAYDGMVHRTGSALGWLRGNCIAGGSVASRHQLVIVCLRSALVGGIVFAP
jgi:hypothetical protein